MSDQPHDAGEADAAIDAPFGGADLELVRAFRRFLGASSRAGAWAGAELDLNYIDVRALMFIALDGRTTPTQLAERLALSTGATTTLVDRLERHGMVHRGSNPGDRRSVVLLLDDAGRAAVDRVFGFYRDSVLTAVPARSRQASTELLLALATGLETLADRPHGD